MEKKCVGCNKIIKREMVFNSWKTYKIELSNEKWERKKFCSRRCGSAYSQRKRYNNSKAYREYHVEYNRKWYKNISPERTEMRSKRRKEYYQKNRDKILAKQKLHSKETYKLKRNRIMDIYESKCAICKYDVVLDIHHVDGGDRSNFYLPLHKYIVLCPNHHAMYHRDLMSKEEVKKYQVVVEG